MSGIKSPSWYWFALCFPRELLMSFWRNAKVGQNLFSILQLSIFLLRIRLTTNMTCLCAECLSSGFVANCMISSHSVLASFGAHRILTIFKANFKKVLKCISSLVYYVVTLFIKSNLFLISFQCLLQMLYDIFNSAWILTVLP